MAKKEKRTSYNKNKTKFVLHKELIFLVLGLIAILVVTIVLSIPSEAKKTYEELNNAINSYNTANSTSYNLLAEDNVYKKASLKTLDKAISSTSDGTEENAEYVYILYGSLSNATVLEFLSVIDNEAQQREVKTVYFYSSEKVDNQSDKEDSDFLEEIDQDQQVFNVSVLEGTDEVDLLETPAVYVYKNGMLVFNSVTVTSDSSYNWYQMISQAFSI